MHDYSYSHSYTHFPSLRQMLCFFLFAAALPLNSGAAEAAVLAVPTQYRTVQSAISSAQDGDTVLLADGIYTGPGNVDLSLGGKNITVTSQHGAAATVIDCGGSSSADHRGFLIENGETNATISGLTIRGGYESADNGGAIYIYSTHSGAITVAGCIFTSNTSYYGGGAILCDNGADGTIAVTNCVFTGNTTLGDVGGGIYNYNEDFGTNTVTNCTLTGNSAPSGGAGGVYSYTSYSSNVLTNNIVYGNTGGEVGDDHYTYQNATVRFCDVKGGWAGTSNIDADPLFIQAQADLHLRLGSPCLGTGTTNGAPSNTLDGAARPAPPSRGAYEVLPQSHLLWTNTNGAASVWNYSAATGRYTQNSYGPYTGYTAKAIADGSDGKTRVLWLNTNGTASLWNLSAASGTYTHAEFGPYPGWTAAALSVATDNTTHILWTNTSGKAALWSVVNGVYQAECDFGPYSGWTANSIADGPDGKTRLLWTNTSGQAAFWNVTSTTGAFTQFSFGPYASWTAKAISAGASTTHILWTNPNGAASVWNYDAANGSFTQISYGPYSGWSANGLADGSDGKTQILWDNVNSTASIWSLNNATGVYSQFSFGPYSGWTATGFSAF